MTKKYWPLLYFLVLLLFGRAAAEQAGPYPARLGEPPAFPDQLTDAAAHEGAVVYEAGEYLYYFPSIQSPPTWINTAVREESRLLFQEDYLGTEGIDTGWVGDLDACDAGTTSEAYRAAMLRRINYFRSMAGVPALKGLDETYNLKAQAAALMMSANDDLNHTPSPDWKCYTEAGSEGAGSSNLALGFDGTDAISHGYMNDSGGNNSFVGHRRWILYPHTQKMGTGDIPRHDNYSPTNALWVFDLEHFMEPRPETRAEFVAWPPPGYVPYQVVYSRWSFGYPGADFSQATVSMTRSGQAIGVLLNTPVDGFGDNTLVWEPQATFFDPPNADTSYEVRVDNVKIDEQPHSFTYTVIVFDPTE